MYREQKIFERKVKKAEKEAQKELTSLKKKKFGCSKDAEQALETLEKKWTFHHAPYAEFEEVPIYKGRGRPKKNEEAVGFYWSIIGELDEKFDVLKAAKKKMGRFILATNVSSGELSKEKSLSDYKAQGSSIERGFRFLKDPMFFLSAFYLQKPSRVMALMMIMTLSLLIYSLAEHDIKVKRKR